MKRCFSIFLGLMILVCQLGGFSVFAADATDPFAGDTEINIVYLGGTYVAEVAAGVTSSWVEQVSNYFETTYETEGVTVNNYNVGIVGDITANGVMRIAKDVLSKNPDLVIVNYSSDANYNNDLITVEDSQKCYESIFKTLGEAKNVPYALGLVIPNGEANTVVRANYLGCICGVNSVNLLGSDNATFMPDGSWNNGSLTQAGHDYVAETIANFIKNNTAAAALLKPNPATIKKGGEAVTAAYKAASTATAVGFTADANGGMTSAAASDTLTVNFEGSWFSMQNTMGTGTYTVSIDNGAAVTVDTSKSSSYGKCGLSNDGHTAVITAQSSGINIKGFYTKVMTSLNDAAVVYATGANNDTGVLLEGKNITGDVEASLKSNAVLDSTNGFNDTNSYKIAAKGNRAMNGDQWSPVFAMELEKGATYRIAFKVKQDQGLYDKMKPAGENGAWSEDQKRMSVYMYNLDGNFTSNNKSYSSVPTSDIGMPSINWCSCETTFTFEGSSSTNTADLVAMRVMLGSGQGTNVNVGYANNSSFTDIQYWYIDDVIVEQISGSVSDTKPEITELSATGDQSVAGSTLSVTPVYSGATPLMGYAYRVYRNINGLWAEVDSGFTMDDSIDYTAVAADAGKLMKVDVVAYDSENEFSAMKTHYFNIEPVISNVAGNAGKLTGTVTYAAGDSMVVMVAFYDSNRKFVAVRPITVTSSAATSTSISEDIPDGAAFAKVMVWNSLKSIVPRCDATEDISVN